MTIAVVIKVFDGFVLASDSATTFTGPDGQGRQQVLNIYNNANKIFNLHKGLPIAGMTWGLGNIGPASIATLSKDLRSRLMGSASGADLRLDPSAYTMEDVANRVKQFFFDERYEELAEQAKQGSQEVPELGYLVGGYSANADQPEIYQLSMTGQGCAGPHRVLDGPLGGASWWGQPEAITRLMLGISQQLPTALKNLGVPDNDVLNYTHAIQQQLQESLVSPAMPIQDAIDLADFLVDVTIQFVRFSPGHPTVGGPVEVASITKHEGFKWVERKHYFSAALNPAEATL